MLKDIEAGKYDGILCWHPDRLCRNMLEGGQIINMLDEDVLKDIKFKSHAFTNDANGKMLLGLLFVFSKQYSDNLSNNVNRGVQGNFEDGKSAGAPKWGYDRYEVTGHYVPNDFFEVVKEGWERRADGETLEAVAEFLRLKNLHRITKTTKNPKVIKPGVPGISKMFKDTIYYGVLTQAQQTVDLRLITNFQPMISEDIFNKIQAMSYGRMRDKHLKKRASFYPLRWMVFCEVCKNSKPMSVGKNRTGSGKHVLSYECKNKLCNRKPKSLRAKHIFNSIYETLDKLELTDQAYERYSKQMESLTDERIITIKHDISSHRGALTHITNELEERALNAGIQDVNSPIYVANEKRITELANQRSDIEQEIIKLEKKIVNSKQIRISKQNFLNLVKTAPDKMRAGSSVEKDVLCRILFLNLRVDNEKVASYLWNEPFASIVKATELSSGGGGKN